MSSVRIDPSYIGFTTTDVPEGGNLYYTDTKVRLNRLDQMAAPTANIDMGGFKFTNMAAPTASTDGVNQAYVTTQIGTREPSITIGTALQYWRGDKTFQTLDTTVVPEGTNLYYTDARVRLNRLDQMATPTANVSMGSHKITSVTDPTLAQDAATKNYVDTLPGNTVSVRKTATESVTSSTTLQDDDHLFLTLAANTNYVIVGTIFLTSASATPNAKIAFVTPSGTINISYAALVTGAGTSPSRGAAVLTTSGVAGTVITIGAGELLVVQIQGTISVGVTGGTFKLQWAQNTSNGTAVTENAGGYLSAIKI